MFFQLFINAIWNFIPPKPFYTCNDQVKTIVTKNSEHLTFGSSEFGNTIVTYQKTYVHVKKYVLIAGE